MIIRVNYAYQLSYSLNWHISNYIHNDADMFEIMD